MESREQPPQRVIGPKPPQRVAEPGPPLLGDWFIYLSIFVLICGVIVITALNFGAQLWDGVVRVPAMIGGGLLLVLALEAVGRVSRSAWAWLPVNRGRALFRFVWVIVLIGIAIACVWWLALLIQIPEG